ncbi:MAG: class I SAM-dependent methyltransferase [Patescibacteria group bacterium]|jgi:hypothetical protein
MQDRNTDYNLDKDKNVLGQKWYSTYGGYFSNLKNIDVFVDALIPLLPNRSLEVLYVASASGLLGERLIKKLGQGHLMLVDVSKEHLDANTNPNTLKICKDLLDLNLGKRYDLIIMRSSLDYFPTMEQQIRVLKILGNHLRGDGLFANQPAYIGNLSERKVISRMYQDCPKIGNRLFQSIDMADVYHEAGFTAPECIGASEDLVTSDRDYQDRYGISAEDIGRIRQMITPDMNYALRTINGFELRFEFPIFVSSRLDGR